MKVQGLLMGVALLGVAVPLGAGQRLAMRVSPAVGFAPVNLVVKTTVEANKDNRAMEIIAESDEFFRSSEVELDGDRAPRTTIIQFRSLPGGTYLVRAVLKGPGGHEITRTETNMSVVGQSY